MVEEAGGVCPHCGGPVTEIETVTPLGKLMDEMYGLPLLEVPGTAEYIDIYGDDSWELDAIEPATLDAMVENAILEHLDRDLYDARVRQQEAERRELEAAADNWPDLLDHMREQGWLNDNDEEDE